MTRKNPLSLLLIFAQAAFAVSNVAVPELLAKAGVQKLIGAEELQYLNNELRRQAFMALPENEYMIYAKQDSATDYLSQGAIGKFGSKFTLSLELYEIKSGRQLSNLAFESENVEGLLAIIRSEAKQMFQSILSKKSAAPAAVVAPVAAVAPPATVAAPVAAVAPMPATSSVPLMPTAQAVAPAAAVLPALPVPVANAAPPPPSGISASCLEEYTSVLSSGGVAEFMKSLPAAAVKVKLQMKSPFGKPKDTDKTSVGISVGCVNALPESPAAIGALLKDLVVYVGFKTGKNFAADMAKTAITPAAASAAVVASAANVKNDSDSEDEEGESHVKYSNTRFGLRTVLFAPFVSGGISGFSGGIMLSFPVIHWELNLGNRDYTSGDRKGNEIIMSTDVLYRGCPFEGPIFYMEGGVQLGIPVQSNYEEYKYNNVRGYTRYGTRSAADFGFVYGFGWNIGDHFSIGIRSILYVNDLYTKDRFQIESGIGVMF